MDNTFRPQKSMFDHIVTPDTIPYSFQKIESRRRVTGARSLLSAKVTPGNRTTSSHVSNIEVSPSSPSSYISKVENRSATHDIPQTNLNIDDKKSDRHDNNNVHPENKIQKFSRLEIKEDISANELSTHQEIRRDKSKMDETKPVLSFNNENSSTTDFRKNDHDIDRRHTDHDGLQKSPHISTLPPSTKGTADAEAHSSDEPTTQVFPSIASSAAESMKDNNNNNNNNESIQPSAGLPSLHDDNAIPPSVEKSTQQYVAGNILDSADLDISASSPSSTEFSPKPESNSSALFIPSFTNLRTEEVQQTEEGNNEKEGQQHPRASQYIIGHPLVSKFFASNTNETIVNVNIGRIEIKAVTSSQQKAIVATTPSTADQASTGSTNGAYSPPLSLSEYLKQRADEAKGRR